MGRLSPMGAVPMSSAMSATTREYGRMVSMWFDKGTLTASVVIMDVSAMGEQIFPKTEPPKIEPKHCKRLSSLPPLTRKEIGAIYSRKSDTPLRMIHGIECRNNYLQLERLQPSCQTHYCYFIWSISHSCRT